MGIGAQSELLLFGLNGFAPSALGSYCRNGVEVGALVTPQALRQCARPTGTSAGENSIFYVT